MVTADGLGTSPKQMDGWMDGLTEEGTEPRQKELVRVWIGLAGWPDRRMGRQMARWTDDRQDGRGYGWVGCRKTSMIVGLEMAQGLAGGWYVWPVDGGGWQPQVGGDDPKQVHACAKIDVWVNNR